MKKKYSTPAINFSEFTPNEYIAACWKIECNVPKGYGYLDNNGNGKYDNGTDKKLTPNDVFGCGEWHMGVQGVPDDGPTANAMWNPNKKGVADYPVYYWRDGNGTYDIHFSKVSDAKWETNPNAS